LAYHNAQLEASAFREQYDPDSFEDLTEPKLDMIHKVKYLIAILRFYLSVNGVAGNQRVGKLIKEWKTLLMKDESADMVVATTGSKRKSVSPHVKSQFTVLYILRRMLPSASRKYVVIMMPGRSPR
jgi:ATP-dependent DNA helicase 2 subunit 1